MSQTKTPMSRARLCDAALLSGAALIVAGLWLIYPPTSFIAAGVMLTAAALRSAP